MTLDDLSLVQKSCMRFAEATGTRKPCYCRENRAMPLQISIRIEFHIGIVLAVSLPQHGFLIHKSVAQAVPFPTRHQVLEGHHKY